MKNILATLFEKESEKITNVIPSSIEVHHHHHFSNAEIAVLAERILNMIESRKPKRKKKDASKTYKEFVQELIKRDSTK